MIAKSTEYALIMNGIVVAKGSKKLILSRRKKEGGQILRSPSLKVGDKKSISTSYVVTSWSEGIIK